MIQIDYKDLYDFIRDLKCTSEDEAADDHIKLAYWYTRSDGCTGTLDLFKSACIIHDFHYRTHHDLCGRILNRAEADRRFRIRMQRLSRLGVCSPIAWWRWLVVRCLGGRFWDDKTNCRV